MSAHFKLAKLLYVCRNTWRFEPGWQTLIGAKVGRMFKSMRCWLEQRHLPVSSCVRKRVWPPSTGPPISVVAAVAPPSQYARMEFAQFPRTSPGKGRDRGGGARRRRTGWRSRRSARPTAQVQRQTTSTDAPGPFLLCTLEKTKLHATATFFLLGRRPQDGILALLCCF